MCKCCGIAVVLICMGFEGNDANKHEDFAEMLLMDILRLFEKNGI